MIRYLTFSIRYFLHSILIFSIIPSVSIYPFKRMWQAKGDGVEEKTNNEKISHLKRL